MRILAKTKYGHEIWEGDKAALELLASRVKDGFWYYDKDEKKAKQIVEDGEVGLAWDFLKERRDAEYEWVEKI
jgi:hypothetical protein